MNYRHRGTIDLPHVRALLEKLESVRDAGADQWQARCPGPRHENGDRDPSLSIRLGEDDKLLLHCHVGCDAEEIVGALGLRLADLFPPRRDAGAGPTAAPKRGRRTPPAAGRAGKVPHPTLDAAIGAARWAVARGAGVAPDAVDVAGRWNYADADGSGVFTVVRLNLPAGGKLFRPIRAVDGGGYVLGDPPGKLPLYGLAELGTAGTTVYVCEGEKCAVVARSVGLLATTSAHGSKSAGKSDWTPLAGRDVVILPDHDAAGEGYARDVAAILRGLDPPARVRVLRLPGLGDGEDVADFVETRRQGGAEEANDGSIRAKIERLAEHAPEADAPADPGPTDADLVAHRVRQDPGTLDRADAGGGRVAALLTDVGNAARFVRDHGEDQRFCHGRGKWLHWTGRRWEADERGRVVKLAMRTALGVYREAAATQDDARRQALARWAERSQSRDRINAMIELAKPDLAVTPDELDADPWLLNCRNGTVDLRTGVLRPHRRGDYLTKICGAAYRADADAPTFVLFLGRIFRTHPDLVPWLQRAIGYGATGSVREQALFFLYGNGANGNTTLLDAVGAALGDYAGKADRDLLAVHDRPVHPTSLADLMGKRLVTCSETNDGARFDEAKLKDVVDQTRIKARFLFQDLFEFQPTHKLFLCGNHRPTVRGTDHGFWRRMRLVPFVETIGDDERDADLPAKLAAEADGILAWIVAGAVRWYAEGLGTSPEVAEATDGYRREMDVVGAFVEEECTVGAENEATARDLYARYSRWCEDNGERPFSQKRFGAGLRERGFAHGREALTGRKTWLGIGLKLRPPGED